MERVLKEKRLAGRPEPLFFPPSEDTPSFLPQAERALEILLQLEFDSSLLEYGRAELPHSASESAADMLEGQARHPMAQRLAELDRTQIQLLYGRR